MRRDFAFEWAVLRALRRHVAASAESRLLVAVSGGADSTALLVALDALCRRGELRATLAVAHLNHGLRGAESDADAELVRALAGSLDLPCFVGERTDLGASRANREERARAARYAFLRETARAWGADWTCVAHTRDDQAETVLMRLARGAGPAALAGMSEARGDGILRPLLEQTHADCVAYLRARGVAWREDSSNADETLFRNRVRHRLLPALEAELGVDVRARLVRLAEQLRQESALAEQRIAELLRDAPSGTLPRTTIAAAGVGAPRLVHAWLAASGVRPTSAQVEQVLAVAHGSRPSGEVDLGSGWKVVRRYEALELVEAARLAPPLPVEPAPLEVPGVARVAGWQVTSALRDANEVNVLRSSGQASTLASPAAGSTSPISAWLDLDRLPAPLTVRTPQPGDRVRLAHGRRKLADILIDGRVPRQERKGLAVVTCGDDVVWVPGVVQSIVARADRTSRRLARLDAERVTTIVHAIE